MNSKIKYKTTEAFYLTGTPPFKEHSKSDFINENYEENINRNLKTKADEEDEGSEINNKTQKTFVGSPNRARTMIPKKKKEKKSFYSIFIFFKYT